MPERRKCLFFKLRYESFVSFITIIEIVNTYSSSIMVLLRMYIGDYLPKNASKAVLLASEGSPSCPRINSFDSVLAPGLSTPAII